MKTIPETKYLSRAGDTIDYICWRHYGAERGTSEAVLAANIWLADKGPVLPAGVPITLPAMALPTRSEQLIELWD